MHFKLRIALFVLFFCVETGTPVIAQHASFVSRNDQTFQLNGKPYYFVGVNYWYGGLLGLEKDKKRGVERLRKELDFLQRNGVTNLRLMAGAEGSGMINGVMRVGPPLQPEQGKFDERVLDGLDLILSEMGKRRMKAVIFLSNNWEWSGGFQQYLICSGRASADLLTRKPEFLYTTTSAKRGHLSYPGGESLTHPLPQVVLTASSHPAGQSPAPSYPGGELFNPAATGDPAPPRYPDASGCLPALEFYGTSIFSQ